jgi:hypothetical protein
VVRLAALADLLDPSPHGGGLRTGWHFFQLLKSFQRVRGVAFGLREVAVECAALGIEPQQIGWDFVFGYRRPPGWTDVEVMPFFLEDPAPLEMALGLKPLPHAKTFHFFEKQERANALAVLAALPRVPESFLAPLWDMVFGMTPQQYAAQALQTLMATPKGSAVGQKGVLAVAGALGGADVPPLVAQYLKTWYGMRAAQCKALLQMLAWVDHPAAVQLLLATSTRFRTAGIRKVAEACVAELAERRGWTIDELADRTVPTADLDDEGVLLLDYGPQTFRARLGGDLRLVLQDGEGRPQKALPEPRSGDDADKAVAAKKAFSGCKKQVQTIVKQQTERLYAAMCAGRRWRGDDFRTYLLGHPIMGHLCRRVVWMVPPAENGASLPVTFRPLGDGTATGPDDDAVVVDVAAAVQVAHPLSIGPELAARWSQHLADYEVEPLLDQLGRPPHRLSEGLAHETGLMEFEGHMLESFKLRSRATRLGYVRGPAEDGGWFMSYRRPLPALGLEVWIEFSGSPLPEENRTVALGALRFIRTGAPESASGEPISLGEVPPVLLSECWNDVRTIAAEGPGFDPNWADKIRG